MVPWGLDRNRFVAICFKHERCSVGDTNTGIILPFPWRNHADGYRGCDEALL